MVRRKSVSMKDLALQGRNIGGSADGISEMSPTRKKPKKVNGRSKSLVDTSSNNRNNRESQQLRYNSEINRNSYRSHSYLQRAPTQDDIYKILNETSDVIRPSTTTGESKRLSPYVPLPAIGARIKPLKKNDRKQTRATVTISVPSESEPGEDDAPKLVREGTYNVLEPKFVKGPTPENGTVRRNRDTGVKEKKKEKPKKAANELQQSSTTIVFGPRLPKEEDLFGEDSTSTEIAASQIQTISNVTSTNTSSTAASSNYNIQNTGVPTNQVEGVVMQKLYYRDSECVTQKNKLYKTNDVTEINIDNPTYANASDKPRVHNAFWF